MALFQVLRWKNKVKIAAGQLSVAFFASSHQIGNCPRCPTIRDFSSSRVLRKEQQKDYKYVYKSRCQDVPEVDLTLPEFIWTQLPKFENLPAMTCALSGRSYTHGEIYKLSRAFGAALLQSGLKRGDVVGILLINCPEYPIVALGIIHAGLIASPANPQYTLDELTYQMNDCEAKCLVTNSIFESSALKLKSTSKQLKSVVVISPEGQGVPQGVHSFREMIKVDPQSTEFLKGSQIDAKQTTAVLPYSSGTTGRPKGVLLTHANMTVNLQQHFSPGVSPYKDVAPQQQRVLGLLPFYHMYGFAAFVDVGLFNGVHVLCMPKFEPALFIKSFRAHKPTILQLVPPLVNFIVHSPEISKADFESVYAVASAAAPAGRNLIDALLEKAGKDKSFLEGYGMTEMSPTVLQVPLNSNNTKLGSCGRLVPNTLAKIIDAETGKSLGPHERGELCLKGPQVMKGYHKNEEATKATIDKDGWFRTGDIGYVDDDDYFYIVDRIKELIKVQGFQVAPAELEDTIRKIPQVVDCAVIGVPDEKCGEVPRAYIVRSGENLMEERVHSFVRGKLSKHKQLAGGIAFVPHIPKSAAGKILRRVLKDAYLKERK